MLTEAKVITTIPVVDIERAKKFYLETLGLTLDKESEWGTTVTAGQGGTLLLYPRGATKADHTVAAFEVDDLDGAHKQLGGMGIECTDIQTRNDGQRAFYLNDPDGNRIELCTVSGFGVLV